MKKKIIYSVISVIVVILIIVAYNASKETDKSQLITKVKKGYFEILVTVTGDLQAKSSVEIQGPPELRSRSLRIRNIKITDLVPEGTVVDSGEYVAALDRSEAGNTLKDIEDDLEKSESQYLKTKLDTTMLLRDLRNQLLNLEFTFEEMQIVLDQSKFEPPATIRKAKIDLDKAKREYNQAKTNYKLKVQQANADMHDVAINLAKAKRKKNEMQSVLQKFTIFAPQPGMVIYKKEWSGEKRKVGSMINPWDLTVATLPDLSTMSSKTYVNEVDISKVKVGQKVRIGVDAFPENNYGGKVVEVANIGEQLPNADAKVFEVVVDIAKSDSILRPAMTTSNKIITDTFNNVLSIPLEAVHSNDSLSFVYNSKGKKKIVLLGKSNENNVIVERGLAENEEVYLSVPKNVENYKYAGLELIPIIKERRMQEKVIDKIKDEKGNLKGKGKKQRIIRSKKK
ncbi:MAG: efflux RND transporter periplasmic adaptor subunit [Bacteroidales bacterium]|jgi:HlyD family secretion protein|nr:efflux RND transporter periplasmic adaptor subunit [Bacteroidales bacterium]